MSDKKLIRAEIAKAKTAYKRLIFKVIKMHNEIAALDSEAKFTLSFNDDNTITAVTQFRNCKVITEVPSIFLIQKNKNH